MHTSHPAGAHPPLPPPHLIGTLLWSTCENFSKILNSHLIAGWWWWIMTNPSVLRRLSFVLHLCMWRISRATLHRESQHHQVSDVLSLISFNAESILYFSSVGLKKAPIDSWLTIDSWVTLKHSHYSLVRKRLCYSCPKDLALGLNGNQESWKSKHLNSFIFFTKKGMVAYSCD